mgnify:CR=1 FL=1
MPIRSTSDSIVAFLAKSSSSPDKNNDQPNSVTAAGSAVVETIAPGTPHEMVTVYHLDGDKLADTYKRVGLDVEGKIIDPRIQEIVKAVIALSRWCFS